MKIIVSKSQTRILEYIARAYHNKFMYSAYGSYIFVTLISSKKKKNH